MTAPDGKKCPGRAVRAEVLENLVWDTVSGLFGDPQMLNEELLRRKTGSASDDKTNDERRKLEAELKRLATQADRFLDLYGDGTFDRDALDQKMKQVKAQRQAAEIGIRSLENRMDEANRSSNALKNLESLLRLVVARATICSNNTMRIEIAIPLLPPDPVFGLRTTRPLPSFTIHLNCVEA